MRPRLLLVAVAMTVILLGVQSVYASIETPVNYKYDDGSSHGELGLYTIMTNLYGAENTAWVRVDDAIDQVWWNPDGAAKAEAKYAGYYQNLRYVGTTINPGVKDLDLHAPPDAKLLPGTGSPPVGEQFTWQDKITQTGAIWSSVPAFNSDGLDHMVTFYITGGQSAGHYVIAFEDLKGGGDKDYQDLVVEVMGKAGESGPSPIPEPATIVIWSLLGAVGGIGVAWRRRRSAG